VQEQHIIGKLRYSVPIPIRGKRLFSSPKHPDQSWSPCSFLLKEYKLQEADQSTPSSPEVKNVTRCNFPAPSWHVAELSTGIASRASESVSASAPTLITTVHFLGTFPTFRIATICFVMSPRLSVRLSSWNNSAPAGWIFVKCDF
jgi:hypothetical protein